MHRRFRPTDPATQRTVEQVPLVMHFPADYEESETRQFRLSQELAKHRRVLYIRDVPMTRNSRFHLLPTYQTGPRVGEVELIDRDCGRGFAGVRRRSWRLASWLNRYALQRYLRQAHIPVRIVYSIGPHADFAVRSRSTGLVIEVNDPPFVGDRDKAWRQYRHVASAADAVTATAPELMRLISPLPAPATLVPNAVSAGIIDQQPSKRPTRSKFLLFVGAVDWRIDLEFVGELAAAVPDWTICMAGPVNRECQDTVGRLAHLSNLIFPGPAYGATKAEFFAMATVGFVPFKKSEVGHCCNPTKVYEYAAFGLPILSTETKACKALAPNVATVPTAADAAEFLGRTDRWPSATDQLRFAHSNTWQHRVETLLPLLDQIDRRIG